jgi:hypothetical protein
MGPWEPEFRGDPQNSVDFRDFHQGIPKKAEKIFSFSPAPSPGGKTGKRAIKKGKRREDP